MQNKDLATTAVLLDETQVIKKLLPKIKFPAPEQQAIVAQADAFISIIRQNKNFSIEEFINRFSLSTDEGIAIMCLAESLLRIPDLQISKEFVRDKLSNKSWESFLFKRAKSFKTIFSSFGIYFSGKFTDITKSDNVVAKLIDKFGQPVFLKILREAIMYLSKSFVFAEGMESGLKKFKIFQNINFPLTYLVNQQEQKNRHQGIIKIILML
jgi:RHH-type proline utilization regulon transcriptional repressor/proline dehydrogenase/delta 1-pyrroline-5-carboxylate dehydrogenase